MEKKTNEGLQFSVLACVVLYLCKRTASSILGSNAGSTVCGRLRAEFLLDP
jgi:hypothetical protein